MRHSAKLLFGLPLLALAGQSASAAIATGNWVFTSGSGNINNTNLASPVWGNGTTDNANNQAIAAPFTGGTLLNVGDSITLVGNVSFVGATASANQFRFGLFDLNAQPNMNGWLGYYVGNSTGASAGTLNERANPNTAFAVSGTGSAAILTPAPIATGNAVFNTANTYAFSLTYTRAAGNALDIAFALTSGGSYNMSGNFTDTTPQTFTFNQASFLSGGSLLADQVNLTNVNVNFTPVPEASASLLLVGGVGMLLGIRRRRS